MKRGSECPIDDCTNARGPGKLVCFSCWRKVPKSLQRRVYAAWNDGDITDDYDAAVEAVHAAVATWNREHPSQLERSRS
jgi:hypothetical protein